MTLLACDFALSVLHLTDGSKAAKAIDAAECWTEGTITTEECAKAGVLSHSAGSRSIGCARSAYFSAYYVTRTTFDSESYAVLSANSARIQASGFARGNDKDICDLIRARISPKHFAKMIEDLE